MDANNTPNAVQNKGGRPVQEAKKDKVFSFRVDSETHAKIVERCTKMRYNSLTNYAVDMLTGKGGTKNFTPFNPDIQRLFCDVEDALQYALRLEKRAANFVGSDIAEDLRGEIQHFKIFVAAKAETLLNRVRDEHFKAQLNNGRL